MVQERVMLEYEVGCGRQASYLYKNQHISKDIQLLSHSSKNQPGNKESVSRLAPAPHLAPFDMDAHDSGHVPGAVTTTPF